MRCEFVNGVFAQRSNRRHGQTGHVFEGRFRSLVIQRDSYLMRAARYVVRNPVRAGLVAHAGAWPWSSYRATAGLEPVPRWLHVDWIQGAFQARSLREARQRYVKSRQRPCRIGASPHIEHRCPRDETIHQRSGRRPPCRPAGSPCAADCPDIVPSDPLTVVRWWSAVRGMSRSTYLPCSRRTRLSLRRHCPVPGNRSEHSQQGREPLSTDRRRVRLCGLSRSLSGCRFTIHGLTPNSRFTA